MGTCTSCAFYPAQMLAAGDPVATALRSKYETGMPYLGLSASQVAELIAFLEARGTQPVAKTGKETARPR